MMFRFSCEQKVFDFNGIKVGGHPGGYPSVMIGSIFYEGENLVKDEKKGTFDKKKAIKQIEKMEKLSQDTGNPAMLDVVGSTSEALINYIDFVGEETNLPFLIDGINPDVRISATKHVGKVGLENRAIYNNINPKFKEEELTAIEDAGIKSAVLLCFNPQDPTIEGRMQALEKVLETIEDSSIEKPLVDPAILDLPDPGPVGKTIYRIKEKYGLPAGCGAHNAVDQWSGRRGMDSETFNLYNTVATILPIIMGADFTLYGPIENAEPMYKTCSLADAYVGYSTRQEGEGPESEAHPLYRVFRT